MQATFAPRRPIKLGPTSCDIATQDNPPYCVGSYTPDSGRTHQTQVVHTTPAVPILTLQSHERGEALSENIGAPTTITRPKRRPYGRFSSDRPFLSKEVAAAFSRPYHLHIYKYASHASPSCNFKSSQPATSTSLRTAWTPLCTAQSPNKS